MKVLYEDDYSFINTLQRYPLLIRNKELFDYWLSISKHLEDWYNNDNMEKLIELKERFYNICL